MIAFLQRKRPLVGGRVVGRGWGGLVGTVGLTWECLDAVAGECGASFYLADVAHFERNCQGFLGAFRSLYPRTRIGYSYKTNYLPSFILRADALGAYSEVVSRFELDFARQLGIAGERIIFNGPVKGREDLACAFAAGALVNADSIFEVGEMIAVAGGMGGGPVGVGIRCWLGSVDVGSRFGVDLRTAEGVEALAGIDAAGGLRLAGLHCHQSGDRSAERYRAQTLGMIRLHQEVLGGRRLDYLDLGGGFSGRVSSGLAAQLRYSPASFADYAEAVAVPMREAYGDDGPELILEPGMALLADTMVFVTRVEAVKLQQRPLAVVDGTVLNTQPFQDGRINLPIRLVPGSSNRREPVAEGPVSEGPVSEGPVSEGPWDVVGCTGAEIDVLHRGYEGVIGVGDYVLVDNVGAYTNVLNAPYVRGTPAIVELNAGMPGKVLRSGSTAGDLLVSFGWSA